MGSHARPRPLYVGGLRRRRCDGSISPRRRRSRDASLHEQRTVWRPVAALRTDESQVRRMCHQCGLHERIVPRLRPAVLSVHDHLFDIDRLRRRRVRLERESLRGVPQRYPMRIGPTLPRGCRQVRSLLSRRGLLLRRGLYPLLAQSVRGVQYECGLRQRRLHGRARLRQLSLERPPAGRLFAQPR